MKKWRLIKPIETSGAMQMAIDEAILLARIKGEVSNTLRFFSWKPACVSVGFFQNPHDEVHLEKAKELGVDVVRRYTGGGAVFHEREITYSLAIAESDVAGSILDSYEIICGAVVEALCGLGLAARFEPINDISAGNKKISGHAQTRRSGIILQHGTILLDLDLKKMFSILKIPDEKIKDRLIKSAEDRVTSLTKELGRDVFFSEMARCLKSGFEKKFGVVFEESTLSQAEKERAVELCRNKYLNDDWTYGR
jgi:lipoate---protein ligase